jgi:nucleotide-binding universal stress UspA family protein
MSNSERGGPEKPGKAFVMVKVVDTILSVCILLLGFYMIFLVATKGAYILLLPSIVFLAIGVYKIRKLYPVLVTSMRKDGQEPGVMHKSVMVPLSRPETIESLVNIACDLLAEGGTLRLLNVIEVPPQLPYEYADTKKANAREFLMKASAYCTERGITPKLEIISARDVPEAVLDLSQRYKTDLIIMGSSQRSVPEKVLFGNVVDRILKEAPCEVVVFSYSKTVKPITYDRILVPTSGYNHAQRALDIAIQFEKKFHGRITSMYVGPEAEAEKAKLILEPEKLHASSQGTQIEAVFKTGNVVDNIVNTAKEGNYTLIIIGSTERPSYYTVLLGSTADEIVKRAPCDVLVVRTKK